MSIEYTPCDPDLPLILSDTAFQREIYDPASALVDYVNALFQEGYDGNTLRQDLLNLYTLDFYNGEVHNGGHSQFIRNSSELRGVTMERAGRAAHMIGLPEMADLLEQCAAFCRDNPQIADAQDGFANRADFLDTLDDGLYALNYTPEERAAYLEILPVGQCDDLRNKFQLDGLDKTIAAVVAEFERLLSIGTSEDSAKGAAALARPLLEQKVSKFRGAEPSKHKDSAIQRQVDDLSRHIKSATQNSTQEDRETNLTSIVREGLLKSDSSNLSRYHIHAAVWIAKQPNLELLSSDERPARLRAIAAASPFAEKEKRRRALDRTAQAMPEDIRMTAATAIAALPSPDGRPSILMYHGSGLKLAPSSQQAFVGQSSDKQIIALRKKDAVSLHKLSENWRYHLAQKGLKLLKKIGFTGGTGLIRKINQIPKHTVGTQISETSLMPERVQLFHTLHVPEAFMQWAENDEQMLYFRGGILENLDMNAQRITWQFSPADEVHRMVACPEFVEFSVIGSDRTVRYPATELAALRNELRS